MTVELFSKSPFHYTLRLWLLRCLRSWSLEASLSSGFEILSSYHSSLLYLKLSIQCLISLINDSNLFMDSNSFQIGHSYFCIILFSSPSFLLMSSDSSWISGYYFHYLLNYIFCDPIKSLFDSFSNLICYPFK